MVKFFLSKNFLVKKCWVKKNLGQNFCPENFNFGPENFWSKKLLKKFGQKKSIQKIFFGQKNFWSKKNFGKRMLVKKNSGQNKFCCPIIVLVRNNLVRVNPGGLLMHLETIPARVGSGRPGLEVKIKLAHPS